MNRYQCTAPALRLSPITIPAETGLEARKEYARLHGLPDTLEVISRRDDLVDDRWRKMTAQERFDDLLARRKP